MIGKTLSHYRIVEKLGEGGMGIVYKARDTRLDRLVAVKVLPPERVADPERKRRFVQEAKAASALNHPNIITIHDIDTAEGTDFIAMEYVPGKALDEILGRKGLRLNEALGYAIQIAGALSAAHAAGIVHRDLKPSNIMVGDDGRVRVVDFGLAKLTGVGEAAELAATATQAGPISEKGAVVGTVAYMSPEQAEGQPVDTRSDVFSFGVLLYEMLVRRHPFRRPSRISTMAAIVSEEPRPLSGGDSTLPPEIERAVLRCLRKEPQRRWQSMSDLKSVLEDLKEESDTGKFRPAPVAAQRFPRGFLWAAAVLAVVLAAAGGMVLWMRGRTPAGSADLETAPLTLDAGFSGYASVSRDGKYIAYASDREGTLDIWVRHINRPQPARRTHDPVGASMPALSPDGSRIVYRSGRDGGGLYIADTLGGDERKLVSGGVLPRFSPDGKWILYTRPAAGDQADNKTLLISPDGGEPRQIHPGFVADPGPDGIGPIWSPDSQRVIFGGTRKSDQRHGWWIVPITGGDAVEVDRSVLGQLSLGAQFPVAWPWEDTLIYCQGATILGINPYRVRMPPGTARLSGPPQRLTSGPGLRYDPSVSADGRLVFSIMTWVSNLYSAPLDARGGTASGEPQAVSHDSQTKRSASVTLDGAKAVYAAVAEVKQVPRVELRLRDMASGHETILSSGSALDKLPRISADGALVAYREATPDGLVAFVSTPEGDARRVCTGCRILGFFPNREEVLVRYGANRLVRQRVSGGSQAAVISTEAGTITDARLSYDGRWVAFSVDQPGGRCGLYIAPVRDAGVSERDWIPVEESDTVRSADPAWSPDGRLLYYLSDRDGANCIWARRLDPLSGRVVGEAFAALHAHDTRHSFMGPRWPWGLNVTRDRLYTLMGELKANVWTAKLSR